MRRKIVLRSADGLGDVEEMLFGMEHVDNLDHVREVLVGDVPDPRRPVSEDGPAPQNPHRSITRKTRLTKGASSLSGSRVTIGSISTLWLTDRASRTGGIELDDLPFILSDLAPQALDLSGLDHEAGQFAPQHT